MDGLTPRRLAHSKASKTAATSSFKAATTSTPLVPFSPDEIAPLFCENLVLALRDANRTSDHVEIIRRCTEQLDFFKRYSSESLGSLHKQCCTKFTYEFLTKGTYAFQIGDVSDKMYFILQGSVDISAAPRSSTNTALQNGSNDNRGFTPAGVHHETSESNYAVPTEDLSHTGSRNHTNHSQHTHGSSTRIHTNPNTLITPKNLLATTTTNAPPVILNNQHATIRLNRLCAGASFGEDGFLCNRPRITNAVCFEDTHFIILSKSAFMHILKSAEEARMKRSVEFLSSLPCFNGWTINLLRDMYFHLKRRVYKHRDYVFEQKQPADFAAIIVTGRFAIFKPFIVQQPIYDVAAATTVGVKQAALQVEKEFNMFLDSPFNRNECSLWKRTQEKKVLDLSEKEMFGEDDLMNRSVRSFSVKCESVEGGEILMISQSVFREFILKSLLAEKTIVSRIKLKQTVLANRVEAITTNLDQYKNLLRENRAELKLGITSLEETKKKSLAAAAAVANDTVLLATVSPNILNAFHHNSPKRERDHSNGSTTSNHNNSNNTNNQIYNFDESASSHHGGSNNIEFPSNSLLRQAVQAGGSTIGGMSDGYSFPNTSRRNSNNNLNMQIGSSQSPSKAIAGAAATTTTGGMLPVIEQQMQFHSHMSPPQQQDDLSQTPRLLSNYHISSSPSQLPALPANASRMYSFELPIKKFEEQSEAQRGINWLDTSNNFHQHHEELCGENNNGVDGSRNNSSNNLHNSSCGNNAAVNMNATTSYPNGPKFLMIEKPDKEEIDRQVRSQLKQSPKLKNYLGVDREANHQIRKIYSILKNAGYFQDRLYQQQVIREQAKAQQKHSASISQNSRRRIPQIDLAFPQSQLQQLPLSSLQQKQQPNQFLRSRQGGSHSFSSSTTRQMNHTSNKSTHYPQQQQQQQQQYHNGSGNEFGFESDRSYYRAGSSRSRQTFSLNRSNYNQSRVDDITPTASAAAAAAAASTGGGGGDSQGQTLFPRKNQHALNSNTVGNMAMLLSPQSTLLSGSDHGFSAQARSQSSQMGGASALSMRDRTKQRAKISTSGQVGYNGNGSGNGIGLQPLSMTSATASGSGSSNNGKDLSNDITSRMGGSMGMNSNSKPLSFNEFNPSLRPILMSNFMNGRTTVNSRLNPLGDGGLFGVGGTAAEDDIVRRVNEMSDEKRDIIAYSKNQLAQIRKGIQLKNLLNAKVQQQSSEKQSHHLHNSHLLQTKGQQKS